LEVAQSLERKGARGGRARRAHLRDAEYERNDKGERERDIGDVGDDYVTSAI